jgi:hypothetical protein
VLNLIAPATGLEGRCAVVPTGILKAPVAPLASIIPEVAVKAKVPVVSAVTCNAVPDDVPADIVDAIMQSLLMHQKMQN